MAVFSLKNSFVNKVEEKNGFIKANLSDSRKKADGSWESFQWLGCSIMGNAKSVGIKEGDKINAEGIIYQEKYQDKWFTKVVIFGISVEGHKGETKTDTPKKSNKVNPKPDLKLDKKEVEDIDFEDDDEFEKVFGK